MDLCRLAISEGERRWVCRRVRTERESEGGRWEASQRGVSGRNRRRASMGRRKMHCRMQGTRQAKEEVWDCVKP